ncbi:hypothetical protein [Lentzea sp. NBRC 105346]|nr:hypothetical protein [Lentzea sp. NBRC 105346]
MISLHHAHPMASEAVVRRLANVVCPSPTSGTSPHGSHGIAGGEA